MSSEFLLISLSNKLNVGIPFIQSVPVRHANGLKRINSFMPHRKEYKYEDIKKNRKIWNKWILSDEVKEASYLIEQAWVSCREKYVLPKINPSERSARGNLEAPR